MILSIDVGEKNFAYCIGDKTNIYAWKKFNVVKKKTQTVIESCIYISEILNSERLVEKCDSIVIEQQMMANIRAQRVAQHIWSWCHAKYPGKVVTFFPSHQKTQYFLGKNKLDAKQRKTWSIKKVCTLLEEMEPNCREMYNSVDGKKDDICDAYLQMIVYLEKMK